MTGREFNVIVLNVHAPSEVKSADSEDSFNEELEQPNYHMKILLGDFNLGREHVSKPSFGNERLYRDSNDNVVRKANLATSKDLVIKRTMFRHRNVHKYTWKSPDGQTQNQIDHILIDRRWHSSILDVRSFRGADCVTNHNVVVSEVRERVAVSKLAAQKFDVERFNLRTLNELEVRNQYQIETSNRFAALEIVSDGEDINKFWGNIKEAIKTSAKESLGLYELKQQEL